jgi:DNA-binding transcriptional LysR family regulator
MIDFDALRVFTIVVEQGGFNAAANALFKTQPAITTSIKKLEDKLGFLLFDRSNYRPQLTSKGETFYQRAKILVQHWEHMNIFASNMQVEVETDITIAIDVFFPIRTLESLFSKWINQYAQTHFHFLSESLGGACERLLQKQADLIISENLISGHAIEVIPLRTERMIAVASPDFVLRYQKQLENIDSLNQCMQVILRDSSKSNFSFGIMEECRHWTVSDVIAKKEIIMAGLGWGRLPDHVITNELASGDLQALKGDHFDERLLTLSAIRLQNPTYGPIVERLWKDLQDFKLNLKRTLSS